MRGTHNKLAWLLVLSLFAVFFNLGMVRAETTMQEYQLKAAFLVNFARFITWPEQVFPPDRQDFQLCVVGADPFGTALRGLETKKINGRAIRITRVDSLKHIPQCHLLFVSKSEKDRLGQLSANMEKRAVVTVSDITGFVNAGGSIEFVTEKDRLSFIINYSALKQQGIRANASMLDLAASVR